MKKTLSKKRVPGRTRGKKRNRVLDTHRTRKRLTASGELVARKQVVLVGRLDVELNGVIHRLIYVVGVDAEQISRIKRMGAAVKRDAPSFMQRFDPGPAVYTGILRNMTLEGFALDVTCAPKDSPVVHLKMSGLDLAGMPAIDGDPDKYLVPLHNSYLLVDGDGSFCFEFAIGELGKFFTEHCTVEQIEGWMRGRLPKTPHEGRENNLVVRAGKENPAVAQPISAPKQNERRRSRRRNNARQQ